MGVVAGSENASGPLTIWTPIEAKEVHWMFRRTACFVVTPRVPLVLIVVSVLRLVAALPDSGCLSISLLGALGIHLPDAVFEADPAHDIRML
jgi:hypothetical protein